MAFLGKGGNYTDGPDIQNDSGSFDDASTTTPSTAPVAMPSTTPTTVTTNASTPSTAGDGITWGTVYKTVGDVPSEGVAAYGLPKADYRNACYMWQVPNGCVVIPGEPLYRMPLNHPMLSAFGFLDTDALEDVIAVSDCSDWNAYVKGRASGKWLEMQKKILQQAVPVQSTAPAPAPTGWNWADCTTMYGQFTVQANSGASSDVQTAVEDANQLIQSQASDCADPINALCPSLSLSFASNGEQGSMGANEWFVTTPNEVEALAAALGWTSDTTVMQKLYSYYNGNTNPWSPQIDLVGTVPASSMGTYEASNGTELSASNCTLTFTLQYALNHSIAKFAL